MGIYERVGYKICNARKRKKMTQKELAEKVGCSVQMIGCTERGTRRISLNFLERVAAALEVDYMDLINHDTPRE